MLAKSSRVAKTLSIDVMTMCTRASDCVRSPLPSLVTMTVYVRRKEVRASDANVGGEKLLTQHLACFTDEFRWLHQWARFGKITMHAAEVALDLFLCEMNCRSDDMARRLAADLKNILTKVCFDDFHSRRFECAVEADLFGNHRLALGDKSRTFRLAQLYDYAPRIVSVSAQ